MHSSRILMTVPALIAAAAGVAACGGSSNPAQSAAKPGQMVAFAQCMRSHGVPNFPDPGSNGNGGIQIQDGQRAGSGPSMKVNGVSVNAPAFQSAMQACRSKLPNGGHPPPLTASRKAAMLEFSQCMRAHGLTNFPDPTFGSGGQAELLFHAAGGLDPSSPEFKQAQAACAKYQGKGFRTQVRAP